MAKMTYGQFHGVIVNDNTNIENMIRGFINESANASVVAVYDDSLVLLDTLREEFYTCQYHYNPDTLSVILEDFDKIELEEEDSINFKVAVKDYLISESSDSRELLNSYMKTVNKSKTAVEAIVAEAVADKDYTTTADFEELSFINEEFEELRRMPFFEDYQERLITHPLNNVLFLDWETPVAFSLMETCEEKTYINSNCKKKARKLLAAKDFKKKICKCACKFCEDVEEGGNDLLEMFADNPSLFAIGETELKEAFAKAIMLDPTVNGQYRKLTEGMIHYIKNNEDFMILREAINIDDDDSEEKKDDASVPTDEVNSDESGEEKKDGEEKEDSEEKKDDKATELTAEDKKKLADALNTVIDKATDEKIKEMAKDLLDKIEPEEDGTKVDEVKEAVRFLSI